MDGVGDENASRRFDQRSTLRYGGLIGAASAAVAVGIGELAAGLLRTDGPVIVVADATVDLSPRPAKELAISLFGTYDKLVLLLGIFVVLVAAAVGVGQLALKRRGLAVILVLALGAVGVTAAFLRRADEPRAALPIVLAVLVGALVLRALASTAEQLTASTGETDSDQRAPRERTPVGQRGPDRPARRRLLRGAVGAFVVAMVGGGIGRFLTGGVGADESRAVVRIPPATNPLPPLPRGSDLRIPGLSPFLTPNREFYRIDTALVVPRIDTEDWRLRVHGLVDRPIELSYADLLKRPLVEADITLTCVSNPVGGDLVGNSRWLGVRLGDLLREAGVRSDADQLLSTSTDGWTCGTPSETVLDDRDALLAIAMDNEALPPEHGFPVRMVVPGLYGYVSATKWVADIELTRFADKQAYWLERGWAERGPIKTMSRIDLPLRRTLPAGRHTVAGVAWAQHRGIEAVELQVDDRDWEQAKLAEVPGIDTWRQWHLAVPLDAGSHTLRVRATDRTGYTQTPQLAEPVPNGASGWHTVRIRVEE